MACPRPVHHRTLLANTLSERLWGIAPTDSEGRPDWDTATIRAKVGHLTRNSWYSLTHVPETRQHDKARDETPFQVSHFCFARPSEG
jgi:hypothetical protein